MERVTVRMARSDRRTPWGFGVTEAPDGNVVIVNVVGGSLADRAGLRNGDLVDRLEDLDNLDINAVDRLLVTAHEKIELIVTRNATTGPTRIWRPEVAENTGAGQHDRPFTVNLQHSSDTRPPQGFNSTALPFDTDSRVKHMQYNSPLGIYSDKSAAEQYVQQTEGFVENQGARNAANNRDEPAYLRSETLRLLKEQERNGATGNGTTLSSHPNPAGLPICFICTRPILGVMARAAGRDLHGDCLSCATCGNSLRNVGHHFIEDKFYCDIHGTQRKAGGRPGMDPNIFVKSSPTSAQPARQVDSPRAAYQPQINRPLSVSPAPSGGATRQVTTHYHTPKTQGILSPSQRGVPTAAFGADLQKTVSYGGGVGPGGMQYDSSRLSPAPSQYSNSQTSRVQHHQVSVPPPVPSNPPPSHESRVPDSVRSAVSPRRSGKTPRQWPPPIGVLPTRYWQIDAADQLKKEKKNYGEDLAAMIKECEKDKEPNVVRKEPARKNIMMNGRRASNISKEQVKEAFEEHRRRKEEGEKKEEKELKVEVIEPVEVKVFKSPVPPEIKDGQIHWTVIHSPRGHSPAKVSDGAVIPCAEVVKPIASYPPPTTTPQLSTVSPITISRTSIPKPFKLGSEQNKPVYSSVGLKDKETVKRTPSAPAPTPANTPVAVSIQVQPPIPAPRSPEIVKSYIVKNSDANVTTHTNLQTTMTRQYTEPVVTTFVPPDVTRPLYEYPDDVQGHNNGEYSEQAAERVEDITRDISRPYWHTNEETERPQNLSKSFLSAPCHSQTTDSSTSPIPSIRLLRKPEPMKSLIPSVSITDVATSPIKITEPTGPSPPIRKDPRHFKRVDFSKTSPVVIPEWKDNADIVDESDILTEASREDDSVSYLKAPETYDGDESEMIDNKSDVTSTFDIEEEEVDVVENTVGKIRVVGKGGEAEKQWRQRAMELLDDDAQTERDLMIVAALNERLQGLREMEDDDRIRAIECIARHQSELEQTQTQLSTLLESAIVYLQNLRPESLQANHFDLFDTELLSEALSEPTKAEQRIAELREKLYESMEQLTSIGGGVAAPQPPERKVFPFAGVYSESAVTSSLHDVLDECRALPSSTVSTIQRSTVPQSANKTTDAIEDSRNFLASRLNQCMYLEKEKQQPTNSQNGPTYTKSTFERTTTETRPHDSGAARGVAPSAGDFRGTGHLTTTTTQQQNGGRVPYCEACKQQIRGAFVLATGKSWCPEHFVCANTGCRRRLLECGFVEEDGQKFCESCFEQHIAPRCAKCSKPIISDCLNALQKKWHPTCFTCAHCQKPFGNSAFYLEQGLPYCEQDWNALFTTKCVSCRYPIEAGDRWVEALGNAFHSNCFTCARCNHNLEGESFFAKNGQPFCKLHA